MLDIHATSTVAFIIAVEDGGFRFSDVNETFASLGGVGREDYVGKRLGECLPPGLAAKLFAHYDACASTNQPVVYDCGSVFPSGYHYWRTTLIPFTAPDSGKVTTLLGFCQDCTQDKIVQLADEAFHEKLSLAIGAIDGGFWVYDLASGTFETSRPLAEFVAGPGHASLNLAEYTSYIHADDLGAGTLQHPRHDRSSVDYRIVAFDGRMRWLQSKRRVIRNAAGAPAKVVALVVDITEYKKKIRTLEVEASSDALTALKNRRSFDRIAALAMREAPWTKERIGLLLIDLNGFKSVNDRYGHRVGDEVLRKVARRLARIVRKTDTLARIGGDEFAVLVRDASRDMIEALAARIRAKFEQPLDLEGLSIVVGASVGIAISRDRDQTLAVLFDRADGDLYAAKTGRRMLSA